MDLQAHPVAEAVAEVLAKAGVGDHPARRCVDVAERRTGLQRLPAGLLSDRDHVVDLALPG